MHIGADLEQVVQVQRQLGDGQTVAHGDGRQAHEAGKRRIQESSFCGLAPQGVGPVQNQHADALGCAGLQTVGQGPHVRVDPCPDVLQINDQELQVPQHLLFRHAGLRVEAVDRDAEMRLHGVAGFHHVVLLLAPQTVLRCEERRALSGETLVQELVGVVEVLVHGCLVEQQAEAGALQDVRRLCQAGFQTCGDRFHLS